MNARLAALFCLVLAALVPIQTVASRIICEDRNLPPSDWTNAQFIQAEFVFLGKVVSETTPDFARFQFPETPEMHGLSELIEYLEGDEIREYAKKFDQRVLFEVLKEWKGKPSTVIEVRNHAIPGLYGTYLESGETYLIFAYRQSDKSLMISTVCNSTIRMEDAALQMQALDDLTSPDE